MDKQVKVVLLKVLKWFAKKKNSSFKKLGKERLLSVITLYVKLTHLRSWHILSESIITSNI